MKKPEIPKNEGERLEELHRLNILDSQQEKDFDDIVELVSIICEVPISLVTLIDEDRQWFKSKKGLEIDSTNRDISFCGHAINHDEVFIIENAVADERFYDNPLVKGDPNIRFYAGMPIKSGNGFNLGTLCVIDSKPKKLSELQIKALKILGRQVSKLIELRDKRNELQNKNDKLEALNELNNKIAGIISHDLKGPIGSLYAYMNSDYINPENPEDMAQLFPLVKNNLKSLSELVDNLVGWSKSINEVNFIEVKMQDLVLDVFSLFEINAIEKDITLQSDIDEKLRVKADITMLKFIIRNLVNNAIKFTDGGSVKVEAKKIKDKKVNIKILDSGVGISTHLLERIKLKDKKVSTKGTRNEKGTGLGLQLVQEFLLIHKSELKIESEEGKGSEFSFILSMAE
jgi:signal transduction histidine kinase